MSASAVAKRFQPAMSRVLVQKIKAQTTTKSGLFLPEGSKGPANLATVLAVGPTKNFGRRTGPGFDLKAGDTVVIAEYGGMTLKLDGEELHVLHADDIFGRMNEGE